MRFVVGSDVAKFLPNIRAHLVAHGFDDVEVRATDVCMAATRLDPDDAWLCGGLTSMERSTGVQPALLPNRGG